MPRERTALQGGQITQPLNVEVLPKLDGGHIVPASNLATR
jgi:hypothetical protein